MHPGQNSVPSMKLSMHSMAKMGGKGSIAEALLDVSENFDSPILRRTVTLFAKGVGSGGQLVRLLNSSAEEVRRIQDLRAELISATRTYTIFLSFIVILVMPFLLAVSTNFVLVFVQPRGEHQRSDILDCPREPKMPSFSGKILITADDMTEYLLHNPGNHRPHGLHTDRGRGSRQDNVRRQELPCARRAFLSYAFSYSPRRSSPASFLRFLLCRFYKCAYK